MRENPKKTFKVGDLASAKKLGREGIEVAKPVCGKIESQSGRFSFLRVGPKLVVVLTKNLY